MNLFLTISLFLGGTALLIYCIEEFIENLSKTAVSFGFSAFFLSVVLAGLDLENWAIGIPAIIKSLPGIAIGSVIGSAVFLVGGGLGLVGLITPFEAKAPRDYLVLLFTSPLLLLVFIFDLQVTRLEGGVLLGVFVVFITYLYRKEKQGGGYMRQEEVEEALEAAEELKHGRWFYLLLTLLFTIGFSIGAEVAVRGAKGIINGTYLDETIFGMTVVGLAASIEEITLTVEPVRKGKKEIAIGNLIGSLLFFSTGNVGLLAVIKPLNLKGMVLLFYWPYLLIVTLLTGIFLLNGKVKKGEGGLLLSVYISYWVLSYTFSQALLGF